MDNAAVVNRVWQARFFLLPSHKLAHLLTGGRNLFFLFCRAGARCEERSRTPATALWYMFSSLRWLAVPVRVSPPRSRYLRLVSFSNVIAFAGLLHFFFLPWRFTGARLLKHVHTSNQDAPMCAEAQLTCVPFSSSSLY